MASPRSRESFRVTCDLTVIGLALALAAMLGCDSPGGGGREPAPPADDTVSPPADSTPLRSQGIVLAEETQDIPEPTLEVGRRAALPAGGADTVLMASGDTEITSWVPRITRVDTIRRPAPPPPPPPPPTGMGLGMWSSPSVCPPSPMAWVTAGVEAGSISRVIDQAIACRSKILVLYMTGGAHQKYRSIINGIDQFDRRDWETAMDKYEIATVRAAVARADAAGMKLYSVVMDEPANTAPGNFWQPRNGKLLVTRARVDSLCASGKKRFPSMTWGVTQNLTVWEKGGRKFTSCEMVIVQYRESKGEITQWRDASLAEAKASGLKVLFSINMPHGGTQSRTCPKYGTDNSAGTLCSTSGKQFIKWAPILAAASCEGVNMWRWEAELFRTPEIASALKIVADTLKKLPARSCARG